MRSPVPPWSPPSSSRDGQPIPGTTADGALTGSGGDTLSAPSCVTGTEGTCAVVRNADSPSVTATDVVQAWGAGGIASATVVYGGP